MTPFRFLFLNFLFNKSTLILLWQCYKIPIEIVNDIDEAVAGKLDEHVNDQCDLITRFPYLYAKFAFTR